MGITIPPSSYGLPARDFGDKLDCGRDRAGDPREIGRGRSRIGGEFGLLPEPPKRPPSPNDRFASLILGSFSGLPVPVEIASRS